MSKTEAHLVSVVMPAYNAETHIEEAINSILRQTYKDFEFIIINDASTDSTLDIIKKFSKKDKRIQIISNKRNLNIGKSLNLGVAKSQGKYIARMDADDISFPNRLAQQVQLLNNNPKVAVTGGDIVLIKEDGTILHTRKYESNSERMKKNIFRFSPFAHPTTMYRKNIFDEFNGYDPAKSPSEDIDLWIKIGSKYDFGSVTSPTLYYRTYVKSSSNKKLRQVELNTIKMRYTAYREYGYKPSLLDIMLNVCQFVTIWIFPASIRIGLFNLIRSYIK